MQTSKCAKIELASGLGLRLLYCKNCDIVELEIGAISLRLSPQAVQRMANLMMKASLNLDRLTQREKQSRVEKTPENYALH